MLLLANTTVNVLRVVPAADPAPRSGLLDPWDADEETDAAVWTVVAADIPASLTAPIVDGTRRGGTRQAIEWTASFPPDTDLRAGDRIADVDSARVWHVDTAISRFGPPGTTIDYVRATLVSVRGLVDGP